MCVCVCVCGLSPTLWDPMDRSSPGSSVHGIFQARILEWIARPFSRGSSQPRDQTQVSCIAESLPSELPWKPLNACSHFWLLIRIIWGVIKTYQVPEPLSSPTRQSTLGSLEAEPRQEYFLNLSKWFWGIARVKTHQTRWKYCILVNLSFKLQGITTSC